MDLDNNPQSIHPLHGENKYTLYFFLKVSILTIIFSLIRVLLFPQERTSYSDHHNDKDTPGSSADRESVSTQTKDVNTLIKTIVDESLTTPEEEHNASYFSDPKHLFNKICSEYKQICQITTRDGKYSDREQLMYQAILIYMIHILNDYLDTHIEESLNYIKLYKDTGSHSRRGSATSTYIKLNTSLIGSAQEFWQVLTHELGHTIDFSVVVGYTRKKDTVYTEFGKAKRSVDDPSIDYYRISRLDESTRRSDANFRDFVSGYGMRGMYEDIAEFTNLRYNHHAYLKTLVRDNPTLEKKYRYFSKIYGQTYFKDTYTRYPDPDERVWDSTQIKTH